jgi:hypothetical protein
MISGLRSRPLNHWPTALTFVFWNALLRFTIDSFKFQTGQYNFDKYSGVKKIKYSFNEFSLKFNFVSFKIQDYFTMKCIVIFNGYFWIIMWKVLFPLYQVHKNRVLTLNQYDWKLRKWIQDFKWLIFPVLYEFYYVDYRTYYNSWKGEGLKFTQPIVWISYENYVVIGQFYVISWFTTF